MVVLFTCFLSCFSCFTSIKSISRSASWGCPDLMKVLMDGFMIRRLGDSAVFIFSLPQGDTDWLYSM